MHPKGKTVMLALIYQFQVHWGARDISDLRSSCMLECLGGRVLLWVWMWLCVCASALCVRVCLCVGMRTSGKEANACNSQLRLDCAAKQRLQNFSSSQQQELVSLLWHLCPFWADWLFSTSSSFPNRDLKEVIPTWDIAGLVGRQGEEKHGRDEMPLVTCQLGGDMRLFHSHFVGPKWCVSSWGWHNTFLGEGMDYFEQIPLLRRWTAKGQEAKGSSSL